MSNTKIVIFQMKEIVYTALFVLLGILLILILIFMFRSHDDETDETASTLYQPGVYSSECEIGDTVMNVEVVVDENHINAVQINNLTDSVTTMYPLVKPSLEEIELQLQNDTDINDIRLSDESRYTQVLLLDAVDKALGKARADDGKPGKTETKETEEESPSPSAA